MGRPGTGRPSWVVLVVGALAALTFVAGAGAVWLGAPAASAAGAAVRSRAAVPAPGTAPAPAPSLPQVRTPAPARPPAVPARPVAPAAVAPPAPARLVAPAAARLQAALGAALAGRQSCVVVEDGAARPAVVGAGVPLTPASTQKLLIAAAALAVLGPHYRFHTTVMGSGPVLAGRVGQLWLVGSGDPVLAGSAYGAWLATQPRWSTEPVTPLAALAVALRATGLRAVTAGVHGDASLYPGVAPYLPSLTPGELAEADVGPLSALTVDEGWQAWQPRHLPTPDPAANAAAQLVALLVPSGVAAGAGTDAVPPAGAVPLASVASAPLAQIVAFMLRSSDNTTAELLTLAVGHQVSGSLGEPAATAAVLAADQRLGIATAGVRLVDGSGLAPQDRATCAALIGALDLAGRPGFGALAAGLAYPGGSGTLAYRFLGTPLQGHLWAKDGFLSGVAAMVGVVDMRRPVRFAVIANGPSAFPYSVTEAVESQVVQAVAAYSASPTAP